MAGPYRRQADDHGDDNLLDLLDDQHTPYSSSQGPYAQDADPYARQQGGAASRHDGNRRAAPNDNFARNSGAGASVIRPVGGAAETSPQRPNYLGTDGRMYSQTSDLHNYEGHGDMDDYPDDDIGELQDYYGSGGLDDNAPGNTLRHQSARTRNSILSLGGGFVGRARNMLGMGAQYSEMDLPLTETAARPIHIPEAPDGQAKPPQQKLPPKPLGERIKAVFGQGEIDYSTMGPRMIYLNNPPANAENKYVDNHISTSKYNVITFLPKFLYEQFSKYSNLFFLFTAILQQIPNVSPTSRYTTIVPLIIVLIVSAIKEAVEDFRRKSADTALNNAKARVLKGGSFEDTRWINVAVGDIVRVTGEESFPADLVLLASSEPEGLCYIETANLDGETNLKIKQALPETAAFISPTELARLGGKLKSEQPNSSLYTYEATLTMQAMGGRTEKELPLQPDQLLLRGATLRNTPWIHGVVVFTGHETKLMRNATATPIKQTAVERMVNRQITYLALILITLAIISTVGNFGIRLTSGKSWWYLYDDSFNPAQQFFLDLCTYWVLYSNLLPISLFVTIDIVKYCQAVLIASDMDIYYDKTDTPAVCRTSSLVEELGQVEYVFSDKTGTLTCNQMDFKQCSIAGMQYADEVPEDRRAMGDEPGGIHGFKRLHQDLEQGANGTIINQFLTLLSTCHTVIPERLDEKPGGAIRYQAASPDEGALVEGAAMLGYKFIARKPKSVTILVEGQELEFELLAVCEFNSTRKRMSAIFRCPDGRIRCYCKGADTVILERLSKANNPFVDITLQHLEEYAADGLRTLCLAMREVPDVEFREWQQVYNKAATTVGGNRADELDRAAEIIERDLLLLGATAIEDKLQDGVPDTIHTLQTAGIKVWVLTGDRQETAINIGMSCKLISEDMTLLIVNEESSAATRDNLYRKLSAIQGQTHGVSDLESLALIIDGKSLTYALEADMEKMFLDLAVMCKAVICCRVSPLQKALVVKLVKRHLNAILLAIGDGANDVSMIQAAHVGVGIAGVEGLQAARSADIAIGQFRYLRKLLLVHGSWSYYRISKVILYSFYKNIAMFMTQFWYSFQNGFSGSVIDESWTLSFYNVLFTVFPPFALGIFDQFVSARLLDRYPQLYALSQRSVFFRMSAFWSWVGNGFYHSLIIYYISAAIYGGDLMLSDGTVSGHWVWGTAVYMSALVTVLGKAALSANTWTKYTVLAIPGSLLIWLGFVPIYGTVAPRLGFSTEYRGVLGHTYPSLVFWLTALLLIPALCLLRDVAWKYARRMYAPLSYHHVQEIQKYNVQDYRPRMEQFQKAVRKVRQVQRMRKQRGYAFSQTDESQARVLNAYDTTRERGRFGELKADEGEGEGPVQVVNGNGGVNGGKAFAY